MRRSIASVILLAGPLCSCAVGPNYRQPDFDSPAAFIGQKAVEQRDAAQKSDLAHWWPGFNDPMLTELVAEAQANNLDVAQALSRVMQAKAGLGAATASLLPSGAIQASGGHVRTSEVASTGALMHGLGIDRDFTSYDGDVVVGWEIDVFGGLRRGREAAQADYIASEAGVVASRLTVSAQVADTYIAMRGIQQRLAIASEQAQTQQRLVDMVGLQYDKGIAAELELRQAEGVLAQVRATIPALESGVDATMNALDVLLGAQPGAHRAQLSSPAPIPVAPSIAGAGGPAELLRRRPDLIVAERKLAASNARIGQAISGYFPRISLSGLLGTASTLGSEHLFQSEATQAQGLIGLRWRLFDFGRVDAEIQQAKGANSEALSSYRLSVLRASKEVEDAFSDLVKTEEQDRILQAGEQSLVRARDATEAAYKAGVVSLIEVLGADTSLLQTRDQRAVAQTKAARAAVASFRALGGGWDEQLQVAAR